MSSDIIILECTIVEVGKERMPNWSSDNHWEFGQNRDAMRINF